MSEEEKPDPQTLPTSVLVAVISVHAAENACSRHERRGHPQLNGYDSMKRISYVKLCEDELDRRVSNE